MQVLAQTTTIGTLGDAPVMVHYGTAPTAPLTVGTSGRVSPTLRIYAGVPHYTAYGRRPLFTG